MKVKDIRSLSPEESKRQLETTRKELFDLRFRLATKQLVNTCEIRRVKKDIARLMTIVREKELGSRQV